MNGPERSCRRCRRRDQPSPQSANPRTRTTLTTRCMPNPQDVRSADTNACFTNAQRIGTAPVGVANHPDRPSVPSRIRRGVNKAAKCPVVLPPHDWSR
jgi:hypothetical protein